MPHLFPYRPFAWPRWFLLAGAGLIVALLLFASIARPLPDALFTRSAVVSLRVTDRNGRLLQEVRPDGRGLPVDLAAVSPAVVDALIAVEDRYFYRHPGVNPFALVRALAANVRDGSIVSGGSTLTMQIARTLRGGSGRTLGDKLAEAYLALRLEWHLTKADLLALWLNRVSFGNRTHGIEAAARLYFGKPALALSLPEAAFLIGLPQSPTRYDPFRHPERARNRYLRVLDALVAVGTLPAAERDRLAALSLPLVQPRERFVAPHLVQALAAAGAGLAEVRTTLDLDLQRDVEALARSHLRRLGAEGVGNAAALVINNATGEVLAYVGSVDFWDVSADGQIDGVRMRRQPGSALKPFTYALALSTRRFTPASLLADIEIQIPEAGGAFSPQNYDRTFHGPVLLRTSLACSYNVPAVRLARELGIEQVLAQYHQAGFRSLERPAGFYGAGLTLGNGEVQLWEMARAYAGLARGGVRPALRTVRWTRAPGGPPAPAPHDPATPMGLSAAVSYLITDMLRDPEARAPAFGRNGPLELPFPCAVKTGTSKDYRDNWAVGYTPRHTVAVWAGNFDGRPMRRVSGVSGAGPLLHAVFLRLGSGGAFERPPGLTEARICPVSGDRPGPACPASTTEFFLEGTAPRHDCAVHRRIAVDTRSGLRADAETPAAFVAERLFTVYPTPFIPWMKANRIPLLPPVQRRVEAVDAPPRFSADLQILYPENGALFLIDPVLRRSFQQVHLRGAVDTRFFDARWRVDGRDWATFSGDAASWPLTPGRHTIELQAVDPDGRTVRSAPVVVRVLDAAALESDDAAVSPPSP